MSLPKALRLASVTSPTWDRGARAGRLVGQPGELRLSKGHGAMPLAWTGATAYIESPAYSALREVPCDWTLEREGVRGSSLTNDGFGFPVP